MKSNVTILCHRGWWEKPEEQNTLAAFARAFDAGLGVELDVRDFNGDLLVSHDPPKFKLNRDHTVSPPAVYFEAVLRLLAGRDLTLAVNVKSCGLAPLFARVEPKPKSWFFFDVAPGDEESYPKNGLSLFKRDYWEANPVLLVSWEVLRHGTDPTGFWNGIKKYGNRTESIFLITDRPAEAVEFFK